MFQQQITLLILVEEDKLKELVVGKLTPTDSQTQSNGQLMYWTKRWARAKQKHRWMTVETKGELGQSFQKCNPWKTVEVG